MSSPVGHTLAGLAIYCVSRRRPAPLHGRHALLCAAAANLPDFDFLAGWILGNVNGVHHGISHSLGFALLCAAAVALYRRGTGRPAARAALLAFMFVLSHVLLDWLTFDPTVPQGIPVFWPISGEHLMSPFSLFHSVRRHDLFSLAAVVHNTLGVVTEILILLPILGIVYVLRRRPARPIDAPASRED